MSEAPGPGLHPLVSGFSDARNYDRGRPRYGPATVAAIVGALELGVGAPVLELGAGTGQLSSALVEAGLQLTAVEPLAETRALLARSIGAERVLEGVAEQIPLGEDSVEAVLAADSFHWFDRSRALPEIRRVPWPTTSGSRGCSDPAWRPAAKTRTAWGAAPAAARREPVWRSVRRPQAHSAPGA
jgi:SAM-dependent methyltransferase